MSELPDERMVRNVAPRWNGGSHEVAPALEDLRIGAVASKGPDQFAVPAGLEVDAAGRMFILDTEMAVVRVFDERGRFIREFGRPGQGPGELSGAYGLRIGPDRHLWIRELRNMRYSVFTTVGAFLRTRSIGVTPMAGPWEGGFDERGRLIDWAVLRPYVIHRDGSVSWDRRARSRTEMTYWPVRTALDWQKQDTLPPFRYDLRWMPGDRHPPETILVHLDGSGFVWFGLASRYVLLKRSLQGDTVLGISMEVEGKEDTGVGGVARLESIVTDERGRLFVFVRSPADERSVYVDVFDPTGVFRQRLALPVSIQFAPKPVARAGRIYAVVRDRLDVPYVVRLRLPD